MIFKQFLSSFGGERVREGLEFDCDPHVGLRNWRAVRSRAGAWSSLFVYVGGFSVLLNCLSQIEVCR